MNQPKEERGGIGQYDPHFSEIPYLNGSLFEKADIEEENPDYIIDAKILERTIEFLDSFKFTYLEEFDQDQELLDPEILGYIFERAMNATDRKGTGAYYTPKKITEYMSKKVIYPIVINKTKDYLIQNEGYKKDQLEHLKTVNDVLNLPPILLDKILHSVIYSITICDPAVGSGAFLLAAGQVLFKLILKIDRKLGFKYVGLEPEIKKRILYNLYGVDLNPRAIEIARLRLWLWLVESYERDFIKPLPNLDCNICIGDSLTGYIDLSEFQHENITLDYFDEDKEEIDDLLKNFEKIKFSYKDSIGKEAKRYKEKFNLVKNPIKIKLDRQIYQSLKGKRIDLSKEQFKKMKPFHWGLEFCEIFGLEKSSGERGFDIVIANPPYVRQEKLKNIKTYLEKNYKIYCGFADLYTYFYERGLSILKQNGMFCYISSNKWMKVKYGLKLRTLLKKKRLIHLVNFFELKVFEDTSTEPMIIILENNYQKNNKFKISPIDTLDFQNFDNYLKNRTVKINQEELEDDGWDLSTDLIREIKNKIKKDSTTLKKFTSDSIFYGVKTGLNKVFVIDKKTKTRLTKESNTSKKVIWPIIEGVLIDKYSHKFTDKYLIFIPRGDDINNYPAVKNYLNQFYEQLRPRNNNEPTGRKPGNYKWYESQDNVAYYKKFKEPKIIYIHTAKKHLFSLDETGYFLLNNCYFIGTSNKYLLAYLNSKLFEYYKITTFVSFGDAKTKGRCKLDYNKMINVPIKKISEEREKEFGKIVDKIIALKKKYNLNKISKLKKEIDKVEKQINQMIYKVYGLTKDEIAIVEESLNE